MGRIGDAKPAGEAKPEEKPEDPPIIKELKAIDDQYLELETQYEKALAALQAKYTEMQQPMLAERKKILLEGDEVPKTGTPALASFWLKALQHHPAVQDLIQSWDEPVLEFLQDIEKAQLDDTDSNKGFRLVFRFAENPYFQNEEICKEYRTELMNPYCGEIAVQEIIATEIKWKEGKDVTVEKVAKKVKGGGAKKQNKKTKEEPRESFFRDFFRGLSPEMQLSEDARAMARGMADEDEDDEDEDDDALIEYLMENDHEVGQALRDNIIPFAIRWYTGEAAPDEDDDDEDEESEEEDDEDEDEESDSSPPRGNPSRGKKGGAAGKGQGAPKEECKQQ